GERFLLAYYASQEPFPLQPQDGAHGMCRHPKTLVTKHEFSTISKAGLIVPRTTYQARDAVSHERDVFT
ncbi:MAG TPA: hypothetical protein VMW91_12005, partial [Desulfosporosinus sp.]|nr:hypothetical protein [Desulfosporosinus sp.]